MSATSSPQKCNHTFRGRGLSSRQSSEPTSTRIAHLDSIGSSTINNIFNPPSRPRLTSNHAFFRCAIFHKPRTNDFRYDQSIAKDTIRRNSIETSRIDKIDFQHNESTAEEPFVSIRSLRQHFEPTLHSPGALYFLSLAQIDFRHGEST